MMLVDCEAHQLPELREYFSFYVPGYKFMPMYKSRKWDGKVRLFNQVTRELNTGLYEHLKKFCQDRMYPLQLQETDYGHPAQKNEVSHINLTKFLNGLDSPFDLRDYQYRMVFRIKEPFCYHLQVQVNHSSSIICCVGISITMIRRY